MSWIYLVIFIITLSLGKINVLSSRSEGNLRISYWEGKQNAALERLGSSKGRLAPSNLTNDWDVRGGVRLSQLYPVTPSLSLLLLVTTTYTLQFRRSQVCCLSLLRTITAQVCYSFLPRSEDASNKIKPSLVNSCC